MKYAARTITAIALAGISLLAACSREQPPRTTSTGSQPAQNVRLRLKWLHQAQFAGFYVADDKKYYTNNGLRVQIDAGGVDFPAVQLVERGAADFGVTGADQILLARAKGIPVVAVAVIYRKSPFLYFALESSNVKTLQDFVGKRVGVKLGGNEELTYRAMLAKAGIRREQIDEVPVKYDMTPLFTNQVVAWPGYSINEPIVAEEQGKKVTRIWPTDYGVNLYADTLFTTEAMIRDHPETVRQFVDASLRGWNDAASDIDGAVAATVKRGDNLNATHESAMMRASLPHLKPDDRPIGSMEQARWQELHDLLLQTGFLKQRLDVTKAFTTTFLSTK
jgi:ABC-type nitrate/sulfonate/bicarbonate transport system substrate-binding protein